jgi:Ca-activated chloride channel family protein
VVSTFRPAALQKLADAAGGRYWSATADETELDELIAELSGLERGEGTERKVVTWQERFQWPLALGVLLLVIEMGLASSKRRSNRRRGIAPAEAGFVAGLIVLFGLGARAPSAFADPSPGVRAWLHNREGIRNLENGKAAEAIQSFGQAQSTEPDQPILRFNQGTAQLAQGDSSGARAALEDAARQSEAKGHGGVAAFSHFNAAVALEKENKLDEAAAQYLDAIRLSRSDSAIKELGQTMASQTESDARRNLEILFRKRQQQQQQQQQDQKQQQDQQQQQNQQQQQDQKSQQQQNSEQNQKKEQQGDQRKQDQDQEQGKQQQQQGQVKETSAEEKKRFQSDLLNEEDANRLMGDLASRERELRARLNRQKGQPSGQGRDW